MHNLIFPLLMTIAFFMLCGCLFGAIVHFAPLKKYKLASVFFCLFLASFTVATVNALEIVHLSNPPNLSTNQPQAERAV